MVEFVVRAGIDENLVGIGSQERIVQNFLDPDPERIQREVQQEAIGTVLGIAVVAAPAAGARMILGAENLTAAGVASAGRAVSQQAGAALARYGPLLGTSAAGLVQAGEHFVQGFSVPGVPPPSWAGAAGAGARVAIDPIVNFAKSLFSRSR